MVKCRVRGKKRSAENIIGAAVDLPESHSFGLLIRGN